jgi:hypothetical protein
MSKPTPIYSGARIVGSVKGGIFRKNVLGSRHFLRTPPGIAISLDALEQAERAGAIQIEVYDRETGTRYRTMVQHLRRAGFELDRGFGRQLALPLADWQKSRHGSRLPVQLSIWNEPS